jgi:dolichyl-phosphate beta-glucosyltransferase
MRYRTLAEDGQITKPRQLPCWQDSWERARKQTPNKRDLPIEKSDVFMSVVVPAYNEEERLLGMLEETVDYLEEAYGTSATNDRQGKKGKTTRQRKANGQSNGHAVATVVDSPKGWEVLIVSDGSTDKTEQVAFTFARNHGVPSDSVRVITLTENRGKGGAVTHGMRHARGQYVVFADADGASKFADLGKLVEACKQAQDASGRAVAVGSRAHMVGSEAVVKVCSFFFYTCFLFHN